MPSICKGCTRVATRGGYCDTCRGVATIRKPQPKRPYRPGREKKYELDNDPRMRELRAQFVLENLFCVRCRLRGKTIPVQHVDHIIPVSKAKHLIYEESNLQSLCHSCHSKKTSAETHQGIAYDYARKTKYDLKGGQSASRT